MALGKGGLCRVPSQGHLAKTFRKKNYLPSAVSGALGKVFSKTKKLCRVPNTMHSVKKDVAEHRYAGQPMPSAALLPRVWHSAKKSFAECRCLPSARHSAKNSLPSAAKSLSPVVRGTGIYKFLGNFQILLKKIKGTWAVSRGIG